jgi:hypothetical protein
MVFFIVVVVSGIRENVGYDFKNYISFYLLANAPEIGFNLVVKGLKLFGLNYNWMFFLFSLATLILVCKGIEQYTSHVKMAFLFYILIPGLYLNSFSIVRQSISIAILFFGYQFLQNKNIWKYVITVLMAAGFHYSSLFAVPFFLLSLQAIKIQRWMYFIILLSSFFLSKINLIPIIFNFILGSTRYLAYATFDDGGSNYSKIIVLNGFVCILLLFFNNKMNNKFKVLYFFVALSTAVVTIFHSVEAVTRFAYYFRIFEIILVAEVIYLLRNKDARLFAIIIIVVGYYGFMFYNALLVDIKLDSSPKMTPYSTFFEKLF